MCVGVGAWVSVSPRMHHSMCGHTRELCGAAEFSKCLYASITVKRSGYNNLKFSLLGAKAFLSVQHWLCNKQMSAALNNSPVHW